MEKLNFDTLSQAMDYYTNNGYTENFKAEEDFILGLYNKNKYNPNDLKIVESYRFEGMTNPSDQSELLIITANDGAKGTMSVSYSAKSSQNLELIKKITE